MGGIAGIFSSDGTWAASGLLQRMTGVMRHRGPDDEGYLLISASGGRTDPRTGDATRSDLGESIRHISAAPDFVPELGLGHRRLSVVDLSAAGHQPMCTEDGTVWVVHDGEIYNHAQLRSELESRGHRFRSRTDTEVILHSYEQWGRECLGRFNGIWGFAIWDANRRRLFCSEDRFGVKPLYYYFDGERLVLASEIRALLETDFIERKPNDQAIFDYLAYRTVDATDDTFFSGIKQLRGAHYLEFSPLLKELKVERYYDIPVGRELQGLNDEEYARRFYELFEDAVRLNLTGDVPLASLLSGGLDSSSIVSTVGRLVREQGLRLPGPDNVLKTFSIRYGDARYDEGGFIDQVAGNAGADSRSVHPTAAGLWPEVERLVRHHGEPVLSANVYGKWSACRLAGESGVKVILDGEGGDELLLGYDFYRGALLSNLLRTFRWAELMRQVRFPLGLLDPAAGRDLAVGWYHLLPRTLRVRVRAAMRMEGRPCLDREFASAHSGFPFRDGALRNVGRDFLDRFVYEKFVFEILPGLLRLDDRTAAAHSMELRVPFLDHRLVELVFSMPWRQKIRGAMHKFVLRGAMNGVLPQPVVQRLEKVGRLAPEDMRLGTHLGDEVHEVLCSRSFRQRSYFDSRLVLREFEAYRRRRRSIESNVWRWVNLELWLKMFVDRAA